MISSTVVLSFPHVELGNEQPSDNLRELLVAVPRIERGTRGL